MVKKGYLCSCGQRPTSMKHLYTHLGGSKHSDLPSALRDKFLIKAQTAPAISQRHGKLMRQLWDDQKTASMSNRQAHNWKFMNKDRSVDEIVEIEREKLRRKKLKKGLILPPGAKLAGTTAVPEVKTEVGTEVANKVVWEGDEQIQFGLSLWMFSVLALSGITCAGMVIAWWGL